MADKKQQKKKQQQDGLLPQANQEQVQQQLAQHKELAYELNERSRRNQAPEDALTAITELDEPTQIALVKALGSEGTIEAADVAQALQNYTPLKTVRKEARRTLLRLESVDIYPQWQPPASPSLTSMLEEALDVPREKLRFWRGEVTDTKEDSGEVQLMLFFEQGERYREVRLVGFLLDFWNDGLKDFFTYVKSKRSTEKQIEQMHIEVAPEVKFLQCTLDEARGMIDDALAVNKSNNKPPHPDYVRNRELVDELLESDYEEEETEDEESELEKALATLPPQLRDLLSAPDFAELDVSAFLVSLENGEYGSVYDSLSSTSPLRQGSSRREWIARHRQWRQEAMPETVIVHFMQQHEEAEDEQSPIIDVGWSYAFKDTAETLPEIPTATLISSETNRRWFLTTFEMVKERGKYCVHDMIDEGQRLLNLPEETLRERLKELHEQAEQLRQKSQEEELEEDKDLEDEDIEDKDIEDEEDKDWEDDEAWEDEDEDEDDEYLIEAAQVLTRTLYYRDAIIRHAPHDGTLYQEASDWALVIGDRERSATYARMWADNVPEQRAEALERLGNTLMVLATSTDDEDVSERAITQAEQAFRESVTIERTPRRAVLLAHVLIAQEKQQQEAEDLFKHALQELTEDTSTAALANVGLGALLYLRGDKEQSLGFFQKAAELSPSYPDVWHQIGEIQLALDRADEAEQSFLRGIKEEPTNAQIYNALGQLYLDIRQNALQAQAVVEQGLEQDPDNPELIITLARSYIKTGELDEAEQLLDEAEDVEASLPLLTAARQELAEARRNSRSKARTPKRRKRK